MTVPALILASASKARAEMLRNAGLQFDMQPANIDETTLQNSQQTPDAIAVKLAEEKALTIASKNPDALVIGSDQVLEFEEALISKSASADHAIDQLKAMQGKTHHLISAVVLAQNGEILWSTHDQASLIMHDLSDEFWQAYQAKAGEALTASVGGYWLEDSGSWLFKEIDGNYFTILGMPLLPLLNQLRKTHNIGL